MLLMAVVGSPVSARSSALGKPRGSSLEAFWRIFDKHTAALDSVFEKRARRRKKENSRWSLDGSFGRPSLSLWDVHLTHSAA